MMLSRNYLMAHYPSDVLFALLIGVFSGFVAAGITLLIFRFLETHRKKQICDLLLNADIREVSFLQKAKDKYSYQGKH